MDTVTHALMPVIFTRFAAGNAKWLGRRGLIAIGVAGALPDLLNPHLSLESRMTSWSHGIPFWLVLSALLMVGSLASRGGFSVRLALCCSGAYFLHLFCDAISGGVNFLHPLGKWIWGAYWVDPIWWVPLDIVCVLTCYMIFRAMPLWKAGRAIRKKASTGGELSFHMPDDSAD